MTKKSVSKKEDLIKVSRIVLDRLIGGRPGGEVWILVRGRGKKDESYVVCSSCGAVDEHSMIRRHRAGCPYVAYFKAMEEVKLLLGQF